MGQKCTYNETPNYSIYSITKRKRRRRRRRGKEKLENKKSRVPHFFLSKLFFNEHYSATRFLSLGCAGRGTGLVLVSQQLCCTHWRAIGATDSMQKESRRALLCKVGKDARHQTARPPERAACKRMRTAKHPIPRTHAVCVCACAYRPIRAYLKNKELFIGMIFPLLLSDVLLLKFHYLLWQVDLFRELDCKNRFLVACPAPGSQPPPLSPPPPPGTIPGSITIAIPSRSEEGRGWDASGYHWNICTLRPLPIEEKIDPFDGIFI